MFAADGSILTIPCTSDADCQGDGAFSDAPHCLDNQCSWDECLVDSECPSGTICVCAADTGGGNGIHTNECVSAACRLDSDCGPNQFCSPSRVYCGGLTGFYCRGARDTCFDPATDCACGGNACVYTPIVGHFVCGTNLCGG
jgi:hypothetical protein